MPFSIDDQIWDYIQTRDHLERQIAFLEGSGRIHPAGATEAQKIAATAAWLDKLRGFLSDYNTIIADLRQQKLRASPPRRQP